MADLVLPSLTKHAVDVEASRLFEYDRRIGDGEVRIITVHGGNAHDPICGDMTTESLADMAEYHALSYCWGDPIRNKSISLNAMSFAVTASAHEALCGLRKQQHPLRLWIDAVCINQDDLEEKNVQVQQMQRIYEHAATTYAWLGLANPELPTALDFLVSCTKDMVTPQTLMKNYGSIKEVLCRPWMSRVWVVQEAILPPRCLVFYGQSRCELWDVLAFLDIWESSEILIKVITERDPKWRDAEGFNLQLNRLHSLRLMRNAVKGGGSMPLAVLVNNMRRRRCSNARDYYYGLRGIDARINGVQRNVPVDYAWDVGELFTRVTQAGMLENDGANSYLVSIRDSEHSADRSYALPSWVPAWDSEMSLTPTAVPTSMFAASGPQRVALSEDAFVDGGKVLKLQGLAVSKISARYPVLISADGRLWNSPEIDMLVQWTRESPLQYGNDRQLIEAMTRTLTMDIIERSNREGYSRWPKRDCRLGLRPWLGKYAIQYAKAVSHRAADEGGTPDDERSTPPSMSMEEVLEFEGQFWEGFNDASEGRCFAITQDGAFALCPPNAQVADLIVVVNCMSVPLVLRQQEGHGDRLRMIGPAYVHGIMDGEAMAGLEDGRNSLQNVYID